MAQRSSSPRVALVTLGCARNDVDSEELAGRLAADGFEIVDPDAVGVDGAGEADVVLVNTCTFVEQAKKDSVDAVLGAGSENAKVVAVGCMAERYGAELAEALPEASAVLGFDHYGDISARLDDVLAGRPLASHTPTDRRALLPISPVRRPEAVAENSIPGHAWLPDVPRRRLDDSPLAPLKLASGCDRRCAFCAIPSFRGAFVSRDPADVVAEAAWLAENGVAEVTLVSENSTSYGKDLGDLRALDRLLPQLAAVPGVIRVRPVYLQPAEVRPGLIEVITGTPGVAAYADLSFQHSSEAVLRRMRRFGSTARFLELLAAFRARAPLLGARSNVIVGFPGETAADVRELERFLEAARLDAVGVFGYSDEDGTEGAGLPGHVPPATVTRRQRRIADLAEELTAQRAEERLGQTVEVLVETLDPSTGHAEGRGEHQQPEVDGSCRVTASAASGRLAVGDLVRATVVATEGVDLVCTAVAVLDRGAGRAPDRSSPFAVRAGTAGTAA